MSLKRKIITVAVAVAAAFLVVWLVASNLPGGGPGGSWQCVGNQWVKFGNPAEPQPRTPCSSSGALSPSAPAGGQKPLTVNFDETGVVVKENDAPVGWQFQYSGSTAYLFFVSTSVCDLGKGPGPCSTSKSVTNIEGSTVKVEGEKDGDKVVVAKLTFIK